MSPGVWEFKYYVADEQWWASPWNDGEHSQCLWLKTESAGAGAVADSGAASCNLLHVKTVM